VARRFAAKLYVDDKNLPTETREEYGLFVAEYLRTPRKK
jgi:hypothetical protein